MPVKKTADRTDQVSRAVRSLTKARVYVGIPDSTADRKPEAGETGAPPSNALIGYWMEFGVPEKNIPPRPFLMPGVEEAKDEIAMRLIKAGEAALTGDPTAVERGLEGVGIVASSAVKQKITDGPFVPLAQSTIEARARQGSKGAAAFLKRQSAGASDADLHGEGLVKPLIFSGQLRRAVTYVVRDRG